MPRFLTPASIKFNSFLKSILLENKPLLACFGFVTRQKWLVSTKINFRKRLNLIDVGVKFTRMCTFVERDAPTKIGVGRTIRSRANSVHVR